MMHLGGGFAALSPGSPQRVHARVLPGVPLPPVSQECPSRVPLGSPPGDPGIGPVDTRGGSPDTPGIPPGYPPTRVARRLLQSRTPRSPLEAPGVEGFRGFRRSSRWGDEVNFRCFAQTAECGHVLRESCEPPPRDPCSAEGSAEVGPCNRWGCSGSFSMQSCNPEMHVV